MDFIPLDMVSKLISTINPNYVLSFEDGHVPKDVLVANIDTSPSRLRNMKIKVNNGDHSLFTTPLIIKDHKVMDYCIFDFVKYTVY